MNELSEVSFSSFSSPLSSTVRVRGDSLIISHSTTLSFATSHPFLKPQRKEREIKKRIIKKTNLMVDFDSLAKLIYFLYVYMGIENEYIYIYISDIIYQFYK